MKAMPKIIAMQYIYLHTQFLVFLKLQRTMWKFRRSFSSSSWTLSWGSLLLVDIACRRFLSSKSLSMSLLPLSYNKLELFNCHFLILLIVFSARYHRIDSLAFDFLFLLFLFAFLYIYLILLELNRCHAIQNFARYCSWIKCD